MPKKTKTSQPTKKSTSKNILNNKNKIHIFIDNSKKTVKRKRQNKQQFEQPKAPPSINIINQTPQLIRGHDDDLKFFAQNYNKHPIVQANQAQTQAFDVIPHTIGLHGGVKLSPVKAQQPATVKKNATFAMFSGEGTPQLSSKTQDLRDSTPYSYSAGGSSISIPDGKRVRIKEINSIPTPSSAITARRETILQPFQPTSPNHDMTSKTPNIYAKASVTKRAEATGVPRFVDSNITSFPGFTREGNTGIPKPARKV